MYYRFESASHYALNSFEVLQQPRLKEAKEYYATLRKQYPETKYADKADALLEKIDKQLLGFVAQEKAAK